MSLVERLKTPPKKKACTVGNLITYLEGGEDYDALLQALTNPQWQHRALVVALAEEGHTINLRHLGDHRGGRHNSDFCSNTSLGVLR